MRKIIMYLMILKTITITIKIKSWNDINISIVGEAESCNINCNQDIISK